MKLKVSAAEGAEIWKAQAESPSAIHPLLCFSLEAAFFFGSDFMKTL
jgi:hypothetical protein